MVGNSHDTDATEGDITTVRRRLSNDPMLDADGICGMGDDYHPASTGMSTNMHGEVHDRVYDSDDAGGAPTITHK